MILEYGDVLTAIKMNTQKTNTPKTARSPFAVALKYGEDIWRIISNLFGWFPLIKLLLINLLGICWKTAEMYFYDQFFSDWYFNGSL